MGERRKKRRNAGRKDEMKGGRKEGRKEVHRQIREPMGVLGNHFEGGGGRGRKGGNRRLEQSERGKGSRRQREWSALHTYDGGR
jgi:hypothetical protein